MTILEPSKVRKQSLTHDDFLRLKHKASTLPRSYVEALIGNAVQEVRSFVKRYPNAAFAWSGGKDSLALQYVCEMAGVMECVLGISDLEYPEFLSWVTENMPEGLTVVNGHLDIQFLVDNPEMLFPQNAKIASNYFRKIQHRAQRIYFKKNKLDCIILGRRLEDGNYVGKGGRNYYENKGVLRYSPIHKFTHVDVFAVIEYAGYDEAPFYSWPRGYRCGTHCWAARQWCESVEHGWSEIYSIDKSIVIYAADHLDSAKRFLDNL